MSAETLKWLAFSYVITLVFPPLMDDGDWDDFKLWAGLITAVWVLSLAITWVVFLLGQ